MPLLVLIKVAIWADEEHIFLKSPLTHMCRNPGRTVPLLGSLRSVREEEGPISVPSSCHHSQLVGSNGNSCKSHVIGSHLVTTTWVPRFTPSFPIADGGLDRTADERTGGGAPASQPACMRREEGGEWGECRLQEGGGCTHHTCATIFDPHTAGYEYGADTLNQDCEVKLTGVCLFYIQP